MYINWCFTLNNYEQYELDEIENWDFNYIIIAKEKGEKGTKHIQGYVEFKTRKRFDTVKRLNERIHWESRKGTQAQAIEYCKKEGDYKEIGTPKQQGYRSDLDRVRQNVSENGMRWVAMYGNSQQIRVAEKFLEHCETPRDWKPEVIWICGESGSGKSRMARELTEDAYTKNTNNKWWTGYDMHEHVIIDDFRDSWWDITYMLGLLDRYEFRVEYKGGVRQFLARKIVITSIKHPSQCYKNTGEPVRQLLRRIDNIIEMQLCNVQEVEGNTIPPLL